MPGGMWVDAVVRWRVGSRVGCKFVEGVTWRKLFLKLLEDSGLSSET